MLGLDSGQRSFFDAGLAVEGLLEAERFDQGLHRLGARLLSDEDFADCYNRDDGASERAAEADVQVAAAVSG